MTTRRTSRRDFFATSVFGLAGLAVADFLVSGMSQMESELLYVGTYTDDVRNDGIHLVRMDRSSGKLELVSSVLAGANPSFLAIAPNRRFLYAGNEVDKYNGKASGAVTAFAIADNGKLTRLGEEPSEGAAPCYVSTDSSGRVVLVANYNGGSVAVLPIQSDGTVGPGTSVIKHTGSGPVADRQGEPHAHCI